MRVSRKLPWQQARLSNAGHHARYDTASNVLLLCAHVIQFFYTYGYTDGCYCEKLLCLVDWKLVAVLAIAFLSLGRDYNGILHLPRVVAPWLPRSVYALKILRVFRYIDVLTCAIYNCDLNELLELLVSAVNAQTQSINCRFSLLRQ